MQRAVGAYAHAHDVGHLLDVHVGCPSAHGGVENEVDDLDDRRVLVYDGRDALLGVVGGLARDQTCFEHAQRVAEIGGRREHLVDDGVDVGARGEQQAHRRGELLDELILEEVGERVGDRDVDAITFSCDRNCLQPPRVLLCQQRDDLAVEVHSPELDDVELKLFREHFDQCALAQEPELDEDVAEPAARTGLRAQRLGQLVFGDDAASDEQLAERAADMARTVVDVLARDRSRDLLGARGLG